MIVIWPIIWIVFGVVPSIVFPESHGKVFQRIGVLLLGPISGIYLLYRIRKEIVEDNARKGL